MSKVARASKKTKNSKPARITTGDVQPKTSQTHSPAAATSKPPGIMTPELVRLFVDEIKEQVELGRDRIIDGVNDPARTLEGLGSLLNALCSLDDLEGRFAAKKAAVA